MPPRVLILDSFGRDIAPFNVAVSELRTKLAAELGQPVDIFETSLDAARFNTPEKEDPFVEFIRSRFQDRPPDLIVPVGAPAVRFVAKYRERLFAQKPVVFTAVDPRLLPAETFLTNATLVTQRVNLPDMVDDILQLQPDTTNVVVVFGTSPLEKFWVSECRREFATYTNRVGFTWLDGLSLERVQKETGSLPPHSFILYVMLVVDGLGVPYDNDAALSQLYAGANAPIYGYFASQFGHGIVGGRLYQDAEVGINSARAAIRILHGEKPGDIPPLILGTAKPVYDWRELKRWRIPESRLPPDSTVKFRQPNFWELYRGRIMLTVAVCLLETGLIIGLFINRSRRIRAEKSLRESERRFRIVANSAPGLIWMSGVDKHCTFFNEPWLEFTGRTLAQELGNGRAESMHPEDRRQMVEAYEKVFDARQAFTLQYRLRRHDGDYRWITEHGVPRFDASGNFAGYIGSCMDITENLRAEEKFRLAVEASPNAMIIVNQQGVISLANAQVEKVFGYAREELLGRSVETLIPERFRSQHPAQRAAFASQQQARPMSPGRELVGRRKDGSEVPVEIGLNPIMTSEGRVFLASIVDVTEHKENERQQREFKRLLIAAHEAERARLARELHDDITQRLVRLAIDLGPTRETSAGFKDDASLQAFRDELTHLTDDVHALSYQLHPSILDYLGLTEAVKTEAERFSQREGIEVELQLDEIPSTLSPVTALELYRITQEALANIARHAKATRVDVALILSGESLQLRVRDNGIGFDTGRRPLRPSLGLASMRERAELLGGSIEIESQPGKGTFVSISVPMNGATV